VEKEKYSEETFIHAGKYIRETMSWTDSVDAFNTNAPTIFYKVIEKFILINVDAILIFSKNVEEYVKYLEKILEVLRENQFYTKMSKCHFGKDKLHYLKHVIDREDMKVELNKSKLLQSGINLLKLDNLGLFRRFIITFERFILGYSTLVVPLTFFTQSKVKFNWIYRAL